METAKSQTSLPVSAAYTEASSNSVIAELSLRMNGTRSGVPPAKRPCLGCKMNRKPSLSILFAYSLAGPKPYN